MKQKIFVCSFFIILVGWMVISFLLPDVYYSKRENRLAAQVPSFSLPAFFNRTWMSDSEAYLEDQMAFRNTMLDMKFVSEKVLGKKENNGIFQGEDGFLLKIEEYQEEEVQTSIDAIQTILQNKIGNLVLMPTSAYVLGDKLPKYQQDTIQEAWFKRLKNESFVITGDDALKELGMQGFYKSDHHLSMRGNEAVYKAWAIRQGKPIVETTFESVFDNFLGSYYRTSSNPFQKGEPMEIASNLDAYVSSITYDHIKTTTSLYERKYLGKADEYAMYLDGNHALTTIQTTNNNNQHLLVFKDSYGNSFVPYLLPYYETITMIDLRYQQEEITTYLKQSDEVMFCYALAGLQDKNVVMNLQKLVQ